MSHCLPPHGRHGICYGCGEPVRNDEVDPKWYRKPHITVEFSLKEHVGSVGQLHNDHYNLVVHNIDCLKKVDWTVVKADILWSEKELMQREDNDIGV